ncbi:MAG: S41 family peptidase [Gammaproteobacteria bacterium]|nr:S41 family peptidase [Gammaproteobacteria bacterium]
MKSTLRAFLILALGLVLGVSLTVGQSVFAEREEKSAATLPLAELRTFTEVFARVKSDYVEGVDDKTLLNYAIRGMLSGLDPHSAYLDADAYKELQIGTSGEFGGLGLEVGMENGFVKVIAPIDDTPAARGGVQAGDLIIRLDDTPLQGMELNDAVKLMRGQVGTNITLTLLRKGEEKPLKITLTRAVIKVKSVKSQTLEPGYGYVRVSQFQAQTGTNLIDAVSQLKKDNSGSLKGMVLDLRNNPGGVLNGAVTVSDAFLEKGLIVYTEGRVKDSQMKFTATPDDVLKGAPMVVLVNGGSASASEIVAGALQDHRRAVIMGSKTFGKGSVQTILPITNDTALKLTTARYYTPNGRSIQAEGIVPDIITDNVKLTAGEKSSVEPLKEADLSRHLSNGKKPEGAGSSKPEAGPAAAEKEPLVSSDYQLYEALNLLKGLTILQSRN